MLVEDFFQECMYCCESSLAHYIQHLLLTRKISLKDDVSKIDLNQADHQKVAEMIRDNVLKIHWIGVYSLKMDEKTFIFIFAGSEEEAIQYYTQIFWQPPLNCHEYPLDFQLIRGNEVISFRNLKKEIETFPAIAGYYRK